MVVRPVVSKRPPMLRVKTSLIALALIAPACGKQKADTSPPEPAPEPAAAPAVDPAVWEANDKDVEELSALLTKFQEVATAATAGPGEAQTAINELNALAKEKGVKEKNINRTVEGSLKANKVKLRGVKRADREAVTAAVQKVLDNIDKLKTAPQAVADARAEIESLVARAKELADGIKTRSEEAVAGTDDAAAQAEATRYTDHVAKVLEAVDGNVKAATGLLDDLDKGAKELATALNITLEAVKAGEGDAGGGEKGAEDKGAEKK